MAAPANSVPTGFSVPGSQGDAASDSLLGTLRAGAQRKREALTVTLDLPEYGGVKLRATYAALGVQEIQRFYAHANMATLEDEPLSSNLDLLSRACRKIEAQDGDGNWLVLEDDAGPVTFDDRLARLLGWERPGDDFEYPVDVVYETMFSGNGFAVTMHQKAATEALGIEDVTPGESTSGGSTRSVPPLRSA